MHASNFKMSMNRIDEYLAKAGCTYNKGRLHYGVPWKAILLKIVLNLHLDIITNSYLSFVFSEWSVDANDPADVYVEVD